MADRPGRQASTQEQVFRAWLQARNRLRLTRGDHHMLNEQPGFGSDPVALDVSGGEAPQVSVTVDACWDRTGDPVHIPLVRLCSCPCGTGPAGTAVEDQILAALAGEPFPASISQILQMAGLHDCPDAACHALGRLEQRGQVQRFSFLGSQYWLRLAPVAPAPEECP